MYRLIFTDHAIDDIKNTKDWYETKQQGLGDQFADYLFKCIEEIINHPLAFPSKP